MNLSNFNTIIKNLKFFNIYKFILDIKDMLNLATA